MAETSLKRTKLRGYSARLFYSMGSFSLSAHVPQEHTPAQNPNPIALLRVVIGSFDPH
jgi:hypothetical protein